MEEFISSKEAILFALNNLKERIKKAIDSGGVEYNFGAMKKESEGLITDEIRAFIEDELESNSEIESLRDDEGNLIIRLSIDEKVKNELQNDIKFLEDILRKIEEIEEFSKVRRIINCNSQDST